MYVLMLMLDVNILYNHGNVMFHFISVEQILTLVGQPIVTNIGITHPSPLSIQLNTDRDVFWCMEVSSSAVLTNFFFQI
jgi:hypothetical protein